MTQKAERKKLSVFYLEGYDMNVSLKINKDVYLEAKFDEKSLINVITKSILNPLDMIIGESSEDK